MREEDRPGTAMISVFTGEESASDCTISKLGHVVEFTGDSEKPFRINDGGGVGSALTEAAQFFHDAD